MPNFKLEIREAYNKKYLKVFLKDLSLLKPIKNLLEKLSSVKKVNITDNTNPDLTVYPSKMSDINETYSDINRTLNDHFGAVTPKYDSNTGFTYDKSSDVIVDDRDSSSDITEEETWWGKYQNHVYGAFTILGVVLAIVFFVYQNNTDNSNAISSSNKADYSIDNKTWVNSDTINLSTDSKVPILDKNIYVGRSIAELLVGGVNSSFLKIGCRTEKGEVLPITYDSLNHVISIPFVGDKYIELEYKGYLYSLKQKLVDWSMDKTQSITYFKYDIYLNPIKVPSMDLKKVTEY